MVKMSNCPPLVAMSVVTRWRRTFSSSVTHLRAVPGFLAVKSPVSPCIRIMSPLLTVAIVSVVCASAGSEARNAIAAIAAHPRDLILTSQFAEHLFDPARRVSIGSRDERCQRFDLAVQLARRPLNGRDSGRPVLWLTW